MLILVSQLTAISLHPHHQSLQENNLEKGKPRKRSVSPAHIFRGFSWLCCKTQAIPCCRAKGCQTGLNRTWNEAWNECSQSMQHRQGFSWFSSTPILRNSIETKHKGHPHHCECPCQCGGAPVSHNSRVAHPPLTIITKSLTS